MFKKKRTPYANHNHQSMQEYIPFLRKSLGRHKQTHGHVPTERHSLPKKPRTHSSANAKGKSFSNHYFTVAFSCLLLTLALFAPEVMAVDGADPFKDSIGNLAKWMTGGWSQLILCAVGIGGMVLSGFRSQWMGLVTCGAVFIFGITFFPLVQAKFTVSFDEIKETTSSPLEAGA